MRETCSFLALILIYPFRTINDLKDNENGIYCSKFVTLRDTNKLRDDKLAFPPERSKLIDDKSVSPLGRS